MTRLLMFVGLLGGAAGYMMLGPEFSGTHSFQEQVALGLLGMLMFCTLFGVKITTILGFIIRVVIIALIWRVAAMMLRVVRLR